MDIIKRAIILAVYFAIAAAAGPEVCAGVCFGEAEVFAKCNAQNSTVKCGSTGIGSSHCFVAVGKYTDENGGAEKVGYINGCMDCSDKKKACSVLKGALKRQEKVDVTSCEIECCTTKMCNRDLHPTLQTPTAHGLSLSGSPVVLLAAFAVFSFRR